MEKFFAGILKNFPEISFNSASCKTHVLVAQPKILKINFVNIITKFYITI